MDIPVKDLTMGSEACWQELVKDRYCEQGEWDRSGEIEISRFRMGKFVVP